MSFGGSAGGGDIVKKLLIQLGIDHNNLDANLKQLMSGVEADLGASLKSMSLDAKNVTAESVGDVRKQLSQLLQIYKTFFAARDAAKKKADQDQAKADKETNDAELARYKQWFQDREKEQKAHVARSEKIVEDETDRVIARAQERSDAAKKIAKETADALAAEQAADLKRYQAWLKGKADDTKQAAAAHVKLVSDETARVNAVAKDGSDQAIKDANDAAAERKRIAKETADAEKKSYNDAYAAAEQSVNKRKQLQAGLASALDRAAQAKVAMDKANREASGLPEWTREALLAHDAADQYRSSIAGVQEAQDKLDKFTKRSTGLTDAQAKTAAMTRTVYFAMQGLEDAQYGFGAVMNNIPLVTMSFAQALGKSTEAAMGWGAALSGAAIIINSIAIPAFERLVATNPEIKGFFDDLGKRLNPFHVDVYAGAIERLETRIKELGDKKIKLVIDKQELAAAETQLEKLKKGLEDFKRAGEEKSDVEKKAGSLVGDFLQDTPETEKVVRDKLYQAELARIEASTKDQRKDMERRRDAALEEAERHKLRMQDPAAILAPALFAAALAAQQRAKNEAFQLNENLGNMAQAAKDEAKSKVGGWIGGAKRGETEGARNLVAGLRGIGKDDLAEQVAGAKDEAHHQVVEIPALEKQSEANKKKKADADADVTFAGEFGKKAENELNAELTRAAAPYLAKLKNKLNIELAKMGPDASEDALTLKAREFLENAMLEGGVEKTKAWGAGRHAAPGAVQGFHAAEQAAGGTEAVIADAQEKELRAQEADRNAAARRAKEARLAEHAAAFQRHDAGVNDDTAMKLAQQALAHEGDGMAMLDARERAWNEMMGKQDRMQDDLAKAQAGRNKRRDLAAERAEIGSAFQDFDPTLSQELNNTLTNRTIGLVGQGLNVMAAMQLAYEEQMRKLVRMEMDLRGIQNGMREVGGRNTGLPRGGRF